MLGQVHVLGRVGLVQQLSVPRVHQVQAEVHRLLLRTLGDHVRKLRVLKTDSSRRLGHVCSGGGLMVPEALLKGRGAANPRRRSEPQHLSADSRKGEVSTSAGLEGVVPGTVKDAGVAAAVAAVCSWVGASEVLV